MVGEAARRRPETGRLVAHLQVIRYEEDDNDDDGDDDLDK